MGIRLLMYLAVILLGTLIGARAKINKKLSGRLGSIQTACLLLLLLVMGIKIGMDKDVIDSFFSIGYSAIIISIFTVGFSILGVKLVSGYVTGGKS
ncbi:LysO family transporter [Gudongella sp. DL1XJH-153]|uniref:LysO family transporter n=1 Tax=Gudongella sp. DL1XJH-153 TaxID=3409804 RepID=UPI003BB4C235